MYLHYRTTLICFFYNIYSYRLTQYHRVVHLDADTMFLNVGAMLYTIYTHIVVIFSYFLLHSYIHSLIYSHMNYYVAPNIHIILYIACILTHTHIHLHILLYRYISYVIVNRRAIYP